MAPEYPPCLVIFKSRFEDGVLKGAVKYVEAEIGEQLRVRWAVESKPEGFDEVRFDEDRRGIVYLYTEDDKVITHSGSDDAVADSLGESRYRWSEGVRGGHPWLMFVLILPEGYTLVDPRPTPAGTKNFDGQLALYWVLKTDALGRANMECQIKQLEDSLESQIERINSSYVSDTPPTPSTMFVFDETTA
jgi:hypothetical protein